MAENMQKCGLPGQIQSGNPHVRQHISYLSDYKKFKDPKHINILISPLSKGILRVIHSLN